MTIKTIKTITRHAGPTLTFAGAVAAAALAVGCRSNQQPAALSPDVWGVVDDRQIHKDEVEKAFRGAMQPGAQPPSESEATALRLNILDELITQDLLLARARTLKIEATDVEINNALSEQRRNLSDAEFQQEIAKRGMTADDIRAVLRRQLSAQKVLDAEVTGKVNVTDDDVTAFYNANRAQFNFSEPQYRLAQIVVTAAKDPQIANRRSDDATTPEEARGKVEMLMARLKSGDTFSSIATDYSEDPQTAPRGGDLGFVPASAIKQAPAPLRSAVLAMKPGSVTTVTQGPNYTILMLVAQEPAGQRELTTPSVRDGIRDRLRSERLQLLQVAYMAAVRNDARVVNNLARQIVEAQGKVPGAVPPLPVSQ